MTSKVQTVLIEEGIDFVQKGADLLVRCLNPDHDDKNPSMRIDAHTGVFHCWSCGHKGNLFTSYGRDIPYFDISQHRILQKITNLRALSSALELPTDARPFLENHRGIPSELYREANAFTTTKISELQDRIVFPITGVDGTILNFVARSTHTNAPPKYMYYPRKEVYVYPQKLVQNRCIFVEGLFDRLNLLSLGINNVHVLFGTKTITKNTVVSLLSPLMMQGLSQVTLLFDGDRAGREGMSSAKLLIEKHCNIPVTCIYLPEGVDPGSMDSDMVNKYLTDYI